MQLLHEQHQQQHANDQQLFPSKQRLTPSTQRVPPSEERLSPSVRDLPPSTHLLETHDYITSPQTVVHEPNTDRKSPTYSNVLNRKNDIPSGSQHGEHDQLYTTAHLFKIEKRLRGTRVEGTAKNCSIRAGNSHNRELFISSVGRSVTVDDFKSYLTQCNIKYVDVKKISSDSACYRSFKLTVHKH